MLFIPTPKGKVTVKLGLFRHSELWGEADEGCDEKAERETAFRIPYWVSVSTLSYVCHVCVSKDRVAPPLCDETTCVFDVSLPESR